MRATYIGFVLVKEINNTGPASFSIAEFFILKRYRRKGIGKCIAWQVFDQHRGKWKIWQKEMNHPARLFWTKVIKEYTKGEFLRRRSKGKTEQYFIN